jgi:pimeloyl-ACP methyl ester carboxylesterase
MKRLFKIRQTLFQDKWVFITIFILVGLMLGTGSGFSLAQAMDCSKAAFDALGLKDEEFAQPVTITSAAPSTKIGTTTVPEHCAVQGTMWPAIRFAVKLPTTWNNRYYQVGNGGQAGSIRESSMVPGLNMGYATGGNDLGHNGTTEGNTWAYGPPWFVPPAFPDNPNAEQKILDFAYRADHENNVLARKLIKAYYGSDPVYAYYVGCSQGGREGLMEAHKYPADFDGLITGSPKISGFQDMAAIWNALTLSGAGRVELDLIAVLADKVYAKCDSMDGLVDGLIDDPLKCIFDPAKDLPVCPGPAPCFTPAQIEALKKVYGGPKNSAGDHLYPGQPFGAEVFAPTSAWEKNILVVPANGDPLVLQTMRTRSFFPPAGPTWDWKTFNFDTDPQKMVYRNERADIFDMDLWPLKSRGGKIIHYHGWSDTTIVPVVSTNYYEGVMKTMGRSATKSFYKLYMVPGMGHCSGGTGCGNVDWFAPLVNWVENGIEPGTLTGTRTGTSPFTSPYLNARTRPLCPYPEVARYTGTGSIDDAANFTCVETAKADVRIEPYRLPLSSAKPSTFTAFIELPHQGDWRATHATCEGALATKLIRHGRGYRATFNKQDLKNITAGDKVTFTVTLFAERHGHHRGHHDDTPVAFEGKDTVKVTQ